MKTILASAFALLLGMATIASATTQTLVFGDSLSDVGRERIILGDEWNSEAYPLNQRTNTVVWSELIGSTFDSGYNFAVGGARALDNGDIKPDFGAQRVDYFTALATGLDISNVGKVAVNFGGNDFRDLLTAGLPTQEQVIAASGAIITEIVTGIGEIASTGLTDFVVFGMPDLSRFPAIAGQAFEGIVRGAVEAYDAALQQTLAGFSAQTGLNIEFYSLIDFSDNIFADADAFGFDILNMSACTEVNGEVVSCNDPEGYFFYDSIHPTGAVHALVAAEFSERYISEVPLPAGLPLMLTGLVAFGLASRRNKSRA